ncbi:class I SAM-dependent DNA methyltransferase [Mycolicibacterium canariasense]|uniref:class I SAM-dependent DNA methyltransferase n=1 Tax=Mycolicibacterium canariasense TaxID=228230 RepID=UPI000A81093B|nr:class I SAM-dependent methyltransferase [Mycolicibacterium canariasense]MCV7213470.1 methyltransferase domain-containing protein [Mycolicibacterium canariasense]
MSDGSDDLSAQVRVTYDTVAREYDRQLGGELASKPLDRALLRAFVELAGSGMIADVGCGPGHVTRFLAELHADVVGVDLSPAMIAIAHERAPGVRFSVGSMLRLTEADGAWTGAVSLYSIIHLAPHERLTAFREFARVIQPGGWLLLAFHVDSPDFAIGQVNHITEWFGHHVELDGYFLDPEEVVRQVTAAGFSLIARTDRLPTSGVEYPSRRCYLLLQRSS